MIKTFVLSLCLGTILSPILYTGQESILSFYEKAYARTQSPPDESKLTIICQQKVDDKFVTFIGVDKQKVLLAAGSKHKLKNPDKTILLKWWLMKLGQQLAIRQLAPDGTMDWGYVFDRNGDGKIDYVAFLMGPLPLKDKDFPADYPKRWEKFTSDEELKLLVMSTKSIFRHWADENFDGKLDAVILEVLDPERDWVDHWLIAKSSHFDGMIDEGWHFRFNISDKMSDLIRAVEGYQWNGFGGRSVLKNEDISVWSEIMSKFNEAAKACEFTKDSFYRE